MWTLSSAQYQATASPAAAEPRGGRGSNSNSGTGVGGTHGGIPDAPTSLPDLERMSTRELTALLSERARFESYIASHPHSRAVEAALAPLRREVEDLVVDVGDVGALQQEKAQLEAAVHDLKRERSDWMAKNTEFHLESRLVALIDEGERDSQALVDEWRAGDVQYPEFIARYIDARTKIAERKLKLDSFREKMQRAKHSTTERCNSNRQ